MSNNTPIGLRARKKLESRSAILEAASRLIEERGYDATTMRDIADAAGVSHQTLYNYFPTKALVVHGLLTADRERFADRMNRLLDDDSSDLLTVLDGVVKLAFEIMGLDVDPVFGLAVPERVEGVPAELLTPRHTWPDRAAYDEKARELAAMFRANFEKYAGGVGEEVRAAGPPASA